MRGVIAEIQSDATVPGRKYHLSRANVWDLGKRSGVIRPY